MADNVNSVTDSTFQAEVIDASNTQPVMVDFWAEWCRPCLMLAPTVAEIATAYAGKIKVVKLNVDENTNSAGKFNIRGIRRCSSSRADSCRAVVGAVPRDQIEKAVQRHLGNHSMLDPNRAGNLHSSGLQLEPAPVTSRRRCHWAMSDVMIRYHDEEWVCLSTTTARSSNF